MYIQPIAPSCTTPSVTFTARWFSPFGCTAIATSHIQNKLTIRNYACTDPVKGVYGVKEGNNGAGRRMLLTYKAIYKIYQMTYLCSCGLPFPCSTISIRSASFHRPCSGAIIKYTIIRGITTKCTKFPHFRSGGSHPKGPGHLEEG